MKVSSIYKMSASLFLIHFLIPDFAYHKQESIKVVAFFSKVDSITSKNIFLTVNVINHSGKAIQVPKNFRDGLNTDPIADFIIQIEKKSNDTDYSHLDVPDEYLPGYDKLSLTELKNNDTVSASIDIAFYYSYKFPSGCYRVRVLYMVSKHNSINDIYSNWTGFIIK